MIYLNIDMVDFPVNLIIYHDGINNFIYGK